MPNDPPQTTPNAAEITRFLKCWNMLGQFEANHHQVHGWGAFNDYEWPDKPDPSVVRVIEWLKRVCANMSDQKPTTDFNARRAGLLGLSDSEKLRRFDEMVKATFSHADGRDLLAELHPRHTLDILHRVDARETVFQGDWLSNLMEARNGGRR